MPVRVPQKMAQQPASQQKKPAPAANVKGQKVENQPFDLAVDVNDSEEIESDEEEDEVNVDVNVKHQPSGGVGQQKGTQQQ